MPTILRIGPYRFFFYSGDRDEAEHIHIERDEHAAKFWMSPVRLDRSGGFGRSELNRIQILVEERETALLEAWHDFFQN
jgi:hypothetical protein